MSSDAIIGYDTDENAWIIVNDAHRLADVDSVEGSESPKMGERLWLLDGATDVNVAMTCQGTYQSNLTLRET